MRPQDFVLQLDPDPDRALYLRIEAAIIQRIRSGHLRPGAALPGARVLAAQLGVNRKTVALAYQELEAEGWIRTAVGSGTTVAAVQPESPGSGCPAPPARSTREEASTFFDLASGLAPLSHLEEAEADLREGLPDPRLLPAAELSQAYQRGLSKHGAELLHYGEPKGNLALREALALWLSERRGILADPGQILLTRGARMGLALLARALPGTRPRVAVEEPGHPAPRRALEEAGAELVPVPVDAEGLRVDALEAALDQGPLRLLHLAPSGHFPTGARLSAPRRQRLLDIAAARRLAIAEDDSDFEFHYDGRPPLPLAAQDPRRSIITVGSFARLLAPGIRVGFLVARASVVDRLARLKTGLDAQGDRVLESALAELIRNETLHRHVRRARKAYQERRDAALALLAELPGLDVSPPPGGLGCWAALPAGFDGPGFLRACEAAGLRLGPLVPDGQPGARLHLRIGFGAHTPREWAVLFAALRKAYLAALSRR